MNTDNYLDIGNKFEQVRFTIVKPITLHVSRKRIAEYYKKSPSNITREDIIKYSTEMIEEDLDLFTIDTETDLMFNDVQPVYVDDIATDGYHLY